MADMTTIHGMLTEIAASTAFTPDALKQFQDALDRSKELEKKLETATREHAYYKKVADDRAREIALHEARDDKRKLREAAVTKREETMTALETKVAVAEAKESVRKEVFDTLFRNVTVRRNFTDSVSASGYQGGQSTNGTEHHTVIETRGEE